MNIWNEVKRGYVNLGDNEEHVVTFLDEEPEYGENFKGYERYNFSVIEGDVDKIMQVTSKRLVLKIRANRPIMDKTMSIKGFNEGFDRDWEVVEV